MNFKKRTYKLISLITSFFISFSLCVTSYAAALPYSGMDISSGYSFPIAIVKGLDGKLYVSDYNIGKISKIDTDGQNKETFTSTQNQPIGLAFDTDETLFIGEHNGSKVSKVTTGSTYSDVKLSLGLLTGIAIDSDEKIFAVSYSYGKIYKMDKDGSNFSEFKTGLSTNSLIGMAIDEDDNLYVSDRSGNKVIKITPSAVVSDFITGVSSPTWITLGDDGFFYVSQGNRIIKKVDSTGTAVAEFSTGTYSPWGTYVDECGYIYFSGTSSIKKIVGSASTTDATHITLTMNTLLDFDEADPLAFTISGVASNPTVTSAEISDDTIILTLDKAMTSSDTNIKVSYEQTNWGDLTTPELHGKGSDYKLGNFTGMGVTNNIPANQNQDAPTGLAGVAPTFATGNGKITGTTTAMEFKASLASDSTYSTCGAGETTVTTPTTYSVRFSAKPGYSASSATSVIVPPYVAPKSSSDDNSSNDISGGGSATSTTKPSDNIVLVNGKEEKAGTETKSTVNGVTQVTLNVDSSAVSKKIEEVLANKTDSSQNLIAFSVSSGSNTKVALTGDIVKQLEKSEFNVSISKDKVEYVIPAAEITINSIANILNVDSSQLKDIEVEVNIKEVSPEVLAKYNEIAGTQEHELVVTPVEFEIIAKATGTDGVTRETTVSQFSNYVERIIEIPSNVDPSKITTGVVFNADGTYSHVPTVVFEKDGKYYAKLNSLTNSAYSVIYNPVTVNSVEGHWSEEIVNDMASRLVLADYTNFNADEAVTRAEFADYIVRALGLYREGDTAESSFADVAKGSKYQVSIEKAKEWGIISGYPNGFFKPDATITREEVMAMYSKAMDIANIEDNDNDKLSQYTDNTDVSSWATPYVERVVNAEIFNGKGNGVLAPKDTLTKAEALTAVRNLLLKSELISK